MVSRETVSLKDYFDSRFNDQDRRLINLEDGQKWVLRLLVTVLLTGVGSAIVTLVTR